MGSIMTSRAANLSFISFRDSRYSNPTLDAADEAESMQNLQPTVRPRDADSVQIRIGQLTPPNAVRPRAHGIRPRKSAFLRDSQGDLQEELERTNEEIEELRNRLQEQLEKRELLIMSLSL